MEKKNLVHNLRYVNENIEENLVRMAATQIANRELHEYEMAYREMVDLSQISHYQAVKDSIASELFKAERRHQRKKYISWAGRVIASLVLVSAMTTGVLYVTVDAARNTINNFFLELHDGYAILHSDEKLEGTEAPLPEGWNGKVTPRWVPERFINVSGSEMQFSSSLVYTTDDEMEMLLITIWSSEANPSVDRENMAFKRTVSVQGVEAFLYLKMDTNQLYLDFVKNDCVVQICGNLSEQEIIKVAENITV